MAKAKVKNATFSWECTNAKGKTVKGETIAASADVVKAELRKQGLTPKKGKIKKTKLFPPLIGQYKFNIN